MCRGRRSDNGAQAGRPHPRGSERLLGASAYATAVALAGCVLQQRRPLVELLPAQGPRWRSWAVSCGLVIVLPMICLVAVNAGGTFARLIESHMGLRWQRRRPASDPIAISFERQAEPEPP